ncbi:TetR/AcrR family transcriptional regulator [Streptomyces sp. HSW2009]|uniref:TetR/AcrR family transcriptional regulator n=1 Tax=Streptomyces sp. HSW2009 TaxID=3142890 RepID=UPI0032EB8215
MVVRKERADAVRNREAVLAAAGELFARSASPRSVSMDDVAAAAGVGKGTLFRRFGDRTGLVHALVAARMEPLRRAVLEGPPPLGPTGEPRERAVALLVAVVEGKLEHRHLMLALEEPGSTSPYQVEHYAWWHTTLRDILRAIPDLPEPDYTAHALLAAVRADLVEHLVAAEGLTPDQLKTRLTAFVRRVLG